MKNAWGPLLLVAAMGGVAACGNLLGIDDWKDPLAGGNGGGGSGAAAASGGGGAGAGGTGGATASVTAGTGGLGGGPLVAECEACLSDQGCSAEVAACDGDASCPEFEVCLTTPQNCCLAGSSFAENAAFRGLYECLVKQCLEACSPQGGTCRDCLLNGSESDVDCGGDSCDPCEAGQRCKSDADCRWDADVRLACVGGTCEGG